MLLFNKFAVLIFYGLLSVAVITLAQNGSPVPVLDGPCSMSNLPSNISLQTIGYVRLYTNRPSTKNVDDIPWKLYNYINVIAFPNTDSPNPGDTPWNGIRYPYNQPIANDLDNQLKGLTDARTTYNSSAKILLSIRNYDVSKWDSTNIVNDVMNVMRNHPLDGVDIEYPGMRGTLCHQGGVGGGNLIWSKDNDADFIDLMTNLRRNLTGKTIMLTVGGDVIDSSINLKDSIDILNIETYHYSLFQNTKDHLNISHPNGPLDIFGNAFQAWNTSGIGENVQRFMGVDFGNTLQVVFNQQIESVQAVLIGGDLGYPPRPNGKILKPDFQVNPIIGICPTDEDGVTLYSFPWSQFSETTLNHTIYCNENNGSPQSRQGLTRKFDTTGIATPWLYKQLDANNNPNLYLYISYEDVISLNRKIVYAMSKSITGMSISDVTYDDNNNSLLTYISINKQSGVGSVPSGTLPVQGNGKSGVTGVATSGTTSTNPNPNEDNRKPTPPPAAVIAGAVIGSVFGLIIISGIIFFGYRNKDKLPFRQNQYSKNMYNPGTHMNNPGMIIPENSPRMILPDTAAIPVAPSYVTAMFDFIGKEENDLSFKKGDKIEVLERGDGPNDWWVGRVNGAVGEFPGNYVKE